MTHEEMVAYLREVMPEAEDFDIEQAIYWYCADNHAGQWSDLYRVLCESEYTPGYFERGCDPDDMSGHCYDALVARAGAA
jgi:hypothetical protein